MRSITTKLFCFAVLSFSSTLLQAATVIVDGRGAEPGKFATISDALAALDRRDGAPDVIQVTASTIKEARSVVIDFTAGEADPLTIVGSPRDGDPAVIVFGEKLGSYAFEVTGTRQAQFTARNLVLIPEYKESSASALIREFPHGGARIRMAAAPSGSDTSRQAQIKFENIIVTSSLPGNIPADPAQRMNQYQPHTRWNSIAAGTTNASFAIESSGTGAKAASIVFTRCLAAHSGHPGFLLRPERDVNVELNECAARFGASDGFVAQRCDGNLAMRDCESTWNGGLGLMFASGGGLLDLNGCRFTCNRGRGVQIGMNGLVTIPSKVTIRSGSFSENGFTDYNLSSAGKFEYGVLVWGGSGTTLDIQGTPENPVLFLENYRRGLRIDNSQVRLERIEHAIFAGRHQESGLELLNLDLSTSPSIRHCAFVANSWKSYYHSQLTIADENSEPATINISDCTFYNVSGKGYHHIAVQSFSRNPTANVTLNISRSIFAGGPAWRGTDEKALYLDGMDCSAYLRDCAFVTEGPYALNSEYIEKDLSGRGNRIIEVNSIHADPNFFPSRTSLREPSNYAARGTFLRPQSSAYLASHTPGKVNLGGFNMEPAPDAPPVQPVRVAIYTDQGPDIVDIFQTMRILQGCTDMTFDEIKARDIWMGALDQFDVIMFPGGSSAAESSSLKAKGRAQVAEFVQNGGGYIGTCAGAYLIMPCFSYPGLNFLDAQCINLENWARGNGIVKLRLSPAGQEILGSPTADAEIEYWQGPLIATPGSDDASYLSLATFASEIHNKGAPSGVMAGTTAIAAGQHGAGRYLAFSPHPEAVVTPMFKGEYVYNGILWTAGRKGTSVLSIEKENPADKR